MAVVLLGSEEVRVDLPRAQLPQQAREGSILHIRWELDRSETEAVRGNVQERIERLRRRGDKRR